MVLCAFESPGCVTASLIFILTYCFSTSTTINGFPSSLDRTPPGITVDRGSTRFCLICLTCLSGLPCLTCLSGLPAPRHWPSMASGIGYTVLICVRSIRMTTLLPHRNKVSLTGGTCISPQADYPGSARHRLVLIFYCWLPCLTCLTTLSCRPCLSCLTGLACHELRLLRGR